MEKNVVDGHFKIASCNFQCIKIRGSCFKTWNKDFWQEYKVAQQRSLLQWFNSTFEHLTYWNKLTYYFLQKKACDLSYDSRLVTVFSTHAAWLVDAWHLFLGGWVSSPPESVILLSVPSVWLFCLVLLCPTLVQSNFFISQWDEYIFTEHRRVIPQQLTN